MTRALVCRALLGVILAAAPAAAQVTDPALGTESLIGRPLPEITVHRLSDEEPIRLDRQRGKVVVIVLFSVWCSACRDAAVALDELHQRHQESLLLVAVAEDDRESLRGFAARRPVRYTVAHDHGDARRKLAARSLPTFVVVDRSGFVRAALVGASPETLRELERTTRSLIGR